MRCNICDAILSKDEINYNTDHKRYDPCGTCLAASTPKTFISPEELADMIEPDEHSPDEQQ